MKDWSRVVESVVGGRSHALGSRAQVATVAANSVKMINVATQLLGFRQIGTIETHRLLCRAISTWRMGEQSGRGGSIVLPASAAAMAAQLSAIVA